MKLRVLTILGGILLTGIMSAQTLTDVTNVFNEGAAKFNSQEYEASLEFFNQVLTMAPVVGDSANDLKGQAERLVATATYKNGEMLFKRKQYDNAIPFLEDWMQTDDANTNAKRKANTHKMLMQSHFMEGQKALRNKAYTNAHGSFDKALAINEGLYHAHRGKALAFQAEGEDDAMLEEYNKAKEGAMAKNDTKTTAKINEAIDAHYNKYIFEEMEMVDTEDNDYSYVVEACENALNANPENPRALYHLALINNKEVEYDAAIDYAMKALQFESEPKWVSAINFELGSAYQNTADYDKACETLQKVVEEPFLSRAEKKLGSIPGCS